jgi:hypothetical protein
MRNYHLALMLSQGTPMLLMGEPSLIPPKARHPLLFCPVPARLQPANLRGT